MENNINSVIKNNKIINEWVQSIITERRKAPGISFEEEQNGEIVLDQQIEAIFKNLTNLCLEIYSLELGHECEGDRGVSFKSQEKTADCSGGKEGLKITTGMQKFIEEIVRKQLPDIVGNIEEYKLSEDRTQNITDKEMVSYVGSTLDQLDYFVLLFKKNGIDMDWVIDILPHEAMHTFGVYKGNNFLKEGITEELTREICQKYQIHMSPTSHTQEAEFVRKLESVVGRDKIIEAGMTGNYEIISKSFDENLELQEGSFNIYLEILENIYALTTNNKMNLVFYRDMFSLDFNELAKKYDKVNFDNLKIACEKFKTLNGREIVSFNDLMQPINKVYQLSKNKVNVDINSDGIKYSSVLDMQESIMRELGIEQGEKSEEAPGANLEQSSQPNLPEEAEQPEGKLGLKDTTER